MMVQPATPAARISKRLTAQDASFVYSESFHGPTHIGSLSFFEGQVGYEDVARQVMERIHLIPRYRQRLQFVPFNLNHATWEDDLDFDIARHVFYHPMPPGTSDEAAVAAAMGFHETILDRGRPLWEMHVFDGLEGDRTLVHWKVHHCMVDGVSGMELTTVLFDFEAEAQPPEPPAEPWQPQPAPGPAEALTAAMLDLGQQQLDAARRTQELFRDTETLTARMTLLMQAGQALSEMGSTPAVGAPWNRPPISSKRSFAWSRFSFGEVRGIRGVLGGTVNDVVLALLGEAAARYLAEHGVEVSGRKLRIGCPVSVRREGETGALGNRVSMMFVALSASPMPATERLAEVVIATQRVKERREPQGMEAMMETTEAMPPGLIGMLSAVSTASLDAMTNMALAIPQLPGLANLPVPPPAINFVATNVPGVQVPQYLAGRRMLDSIGLIPLAGTLGYGVAIQTYNQNLYIGMMAEPRVMPDVRRMKDHVEAAYASLREAALAAG
ncbi:MAG: wax ester/triacylglycerol synthase family O-acyltransferase [Dehalococcoidia bacterium]